MANTKDWALYYAELGIAVHPLHPRSKQPIWSNWSQLPRLTKEQIQSFDWKNFNLGVRPGPASPLPDGHVLAIIDFDLSPECTGDEHEQALARLREILPGHPVPTMVSGSGGESRHYWVSMPTEAAQRGKVLGASSRKDSEGHHVWEVRLLAGGNQAVVPPSVHPAGGPYLWQTRPDEVPLDQWRLDGRVVNELRERPDRAPDAEMPPLLPPALTPRVEGLRLPDDVRQFLTTGEYMPGRDGNASIQRAANQLYRCGLTDAQVLSVLMNTPAREVAAKRRPQDAEGQADWIWKYACAKGRAFAPPDITELLSTEPPSPEQEAAQLLAPVADFETLMAEVTGFDETTSAEVVRALLRRSLHLGPSEMDRLLQHLSETVKVTKGALREEMRLMRPTPGQQTVMDRNWYAQWAYVSEQHVFYHPETRIVLRPEAFRAQHAHLEENVLEEALTMNRVHKVTRMDFFPGAPLYFTEHGVSYVNGWSGLIDEGAPGDAGTWLRHFEVMGLEEHRDHILAWMAFTLRHPEVKINHALLLGGLEGIGKDFLLYPLITALGEDVAAKVISGEELLRDFNEYLLGRKFLLINETEMGNRKEARQVTAKLKPLTAAPPTRLEVNVKGLRSISVRNLVSVALTTNSRLPLQLESDSRRYYAVWSDLVTRDREGEMLPEWIAYWARAWHWMRQEGGVRACIHHLLHEVDLSRFDPGAAPKTTGFVKEIQEASRSPLVAYLSDSIAEGKGLWGRDLLSRQELWEAVDRDVMGRRQYGIDRVPGPNQLLHYALEHRVVERVRAKDPANSSYRLLMLRNAEQYKGLTPRQFWDAYQAEKTAWEQAQEKGPTVQREEDE